MTKKLLILVVLLFGSVWLYTLPTSSLSSDDKLCPVFHYAEQRTGFYKPLVICGDANGDGNTTVSDVVYLINYLFKGGPAPTPDPVKSGDPNGDNKVTVSDVVYLVNYLFKGGPLPTCSSGEIPPGSGGTASVGLSSPNEVLHDEIHTGFYKPLYVCGDANNDGVLSVSDVVYLINFLFKGGRGVINPIQGDPNQDGKITVADVVYLINFLFKGGTYPCATGRIPSDGIA